MFLVTLAATLPPARAGAQLTVRSWLRWRTVETEHFAFHYPAELEVWTRDAASRIESIDSAVKRLVGFAPAGKTHVVVDDPYEISNGSAWPYLNKPVMNLWAAPPDPREDIGEFTRWDDMLAVHEFAHIAHLTRPSRNAFMRQLWSTLAVNLGPVAIRAPRWVIEGYATYVEGRVTGSGRPNGTWRPAFLRQWALEGQLPAYDRLNASAAYEGGSFAYLAGSAFLEWLVDKHGDSSLVDIWRRLSAKQNRTFDEAFSGVFGESPRTLYARFSAELTSNAIAVERELRSAGADTGEIVQRTTWSTGEPAFSADGKQVALVLRSATRPSRVVIWKTAPEPDTGKARRDSVLHNRDPEDVAARSIYPPTKKSLATLRSSGGSPYESPRFLRDGRVLLWRRTAQRDGSLKSDLYLWDPTRNRVRRITRGASLRDPDPTPDGRYAVATQCRRGWCSVVAVDLASGAVRTILPGSPSESFYRPRVAPNGKNVVASVATDGRWQLIIFPFDAGPASVTAGVGPRDGANRYDPAFISDDTVVTVSTRGGIANLEKMHLPTGVVIPMTSVTGAAVAPAFNTVDRSIWFLSLYSRGYDVRRVEGSARAPTRLADLGQRFAPAVPAGSTQLTRFSTNPVSASRPFGFGPRLFRWVPQPFADADGGSIGLGLVSGDLIGRSEILVVGVGGHASQSRGAAAELTWRGFGPSLRARAFVAQQQPSASRSPVPVLAALDAEMRGGDLTIDRVVSFDAWGYRYRIGASGAAVQGTGRAPAWSTSTSTARALAFVDWSASWTKRGDASSLTASLGATTTRGRSFDRSFTRGTGSVGLSLRTPVLFPISASASYGATSSDAAPFEQFAIGGGRSPLIDQAVMSQRISMPALPLGTSVGSTVATYRVGVSTQPVSWYFWSGSTAASGSSFDIWHRVIGVEWNQSVAHIPLAGTPAARAQVGIGESLDAPFRHKLRGYVSLILNP